MNNIMKNTAKFAVGTCIALGSVAVAASVVAGSSAAKVVTAEVKAAKDATKEEKERVWQLVKENFLQEEHVEDAI